MFFHVTYTFLFFLPREKERHLNGPNIRAMISIGPISVQCLADGLKEVPKCMKKPCELTLAKYGIRIVSIKL